jgi:hypothetical protein
MIALLPMSRAGLVAALLACALLFMIFGASIAIFLGTNREVERRDGGRMRTAQTRSRFTERPRRL